MPTKGQNRKDYGSLMGVVEYINRELEKIKNELKLEMQLASAQIAGLHGELKDVHDNSSSAIAKEIRFSYLQNQTIYDGLASMLTKEVGERLAAAPGSKAYGILSILIQLWYDVEYLFTVDENVFSPPPKVKSAVVRMKRNKREELECDESLFKKIVKGTFNQRRKKLRNSIQQIVGKNSTLLSDPILDKRPEQLSIEDFIDLTKRVEKELE